ncbi:MAG: YigZ family protein [Clostridia bacterium]|nr:YigZ family protein [Clostridia bacterium]
MDKTIGYTTISSEIISEEFVINKSRFIGYAKGITDIDDAKWFIKQISKKHYDATHNCYAYLLDTYAKYGDDGEPQGTAGLPILDCIKKNELTNVCVVVTRYYGGVKLGAGGLVRAYSQGASTVLASAKLLNYYPCALIEIQLSYDNYQPVLNYLPKVADYAIVKSVDYADSVCVRCAVKVDKVQQLEQTISNYSNGKAIWQITDYTYQLYN